MFSFSIFFLYGEFKLKLATYLGLRTAEARQEFHQCAYFEWLECPKNFLRLQTSRKNNSLSCSFVLSLTLSLSLPLPLSHSLNVLHPSFYPIPLFIYFSLLIFLLFKSLSTSHCKTLPTSLSTSLSLFDLYLSLSTSLPLLSLFLFLLISLSYSTIQKHHFYLSFLVSFCISINFFSLSTQKNLSQYLCHISSISIFLYVPTFFTRLTDFDTSIKNRVIVRDVYLFFSKLSQAPKIELDWNFVQQG